ncbi:MAG: hypothetical protein HY658_01055 [Actinobacteria bacterium]|nr:hypothetical protein [Actinomycetota bacterium]
MEITTALLADAATVADGKLYVHGGGWDRITTRSLPAVHPALAVVLVFRVPYDEALTPHPFHIELLDADDNAVGPAADGTLNVGHAPTAVRGAPSFVPFTWTLQNLELPAAGAYRFRVGTHEDELASIFFVVAETGR